jgi:hypothetical protein
VNVVVTPEACCVRRIVGVTAWCVLEEIVLDATAAEGALVAYTNVRRLAAQLGISKDTVARALQRLAGAGVVRRVAGIRGERGALPTSSYVVDLSAVDGITVDETARASTRAGAASTPAPSPASAHRAQPRSSSRVHNAQSSLFDSPSHVT